MTIDEVLPRLGEAVALRCSVLPGRDGAYDVPVEHRRLGRLGKGSRRLLGELPAGGSFDQLRCILEEGPLGLFAPRLRPLVKPPRVEGQGTWGAILVLPPAEWKAARRRLAGWQFEGVEAAFGGLPYAFEDVLVFAALNFSPDAGSRC